MRNTRSAFHRSSCALGLSLCAPRLSPAPPPEPVVMRRAVEGRGCGASTSSTRTCRGLIGRRDQPDDQLGGFCVRQALLG